MKKIIFTLIILSSFNLFSQVNEEDASNFLESYFSPLGESLGAGLNNGWYNTAKPHKLAGFDITLTLNTVTIPNSDLNFNPNDVPNFSSSSSSTPTLLGSGNGADINYNGLNFSMPNQTIEKSIVPVPMLNAGVGLIKETEIDIRYVPTYNYKLGFAGKGSIGLWGIGLKHDILQWIPIIGDAIPINLSVQMGHTNLNTKFDIEANGAKQNVDLDIQATTVNIIASKKILMLTAHAGLGYNSSTTKFNSSTAFSIGDINNAIDFNIPLDIKFESHNEFRANIGLRFNLSLITLQANHTFSKYPVTTLGCGISIR